METDEFEEMVTLEQIVVRGTTARYDPKFEPKTLMLLRRCVVAIDDDGKLYPKPNDNVPLLSKTDAVTDKLEPMPLEMRHVTRVS